jgi:asparagine synthetase B (glutamine-hydrolysing)
VHAGRSRLDVPALAARVAMSLPDTLGETPYEGITCSLEERASMLQSLEDAAEPRSPEEAARALLIEREAAVDRALASVRRVAVLAGGGVDSAGLLALTVDWARRTGGSAFAVALDFASPGDDRPHLRALESSLGCEVVRVSPEDAAPRISLMRGVDAAPFPWPVAPMEVELMARARALGAERVLMGVGGDELFDGDPRSLSALLREGSVRKAFHLARTLRGFDRPRFPMASWAVRPLLARCMPRALRVRRARQRPVQVPTWAGPALTAYLHRAHDGRVEAAAESLMRGDDPLAPLKAVETRYREYLAWCRHAEAAASGVERVDPFLDRTLAARVERIPRAWMLHGATRRGLFREAMRTLLPSSVRLRDDKASFEPAMTRFVASVGGLSSLRELATATELHAHGLVDRRAFVATFDAFVAAPEQREAWTALWPALCVEAFLRNHAHS